MIYTETAIRSANARIRRMGSEAAFVWALDVIAAPVASANERAVAYALYDIVNE